MIKDIREINFPEYATLSEATVNIADMGERIITTQINIDSDVVPDFSYDWEIEYKGDRYIHTARTPQAVKENTSIKTSIDLTFKHWAIAELQRYYFVEMASTEAGTAIADKYKASLGLSLPDFVNAFNTVLDYYFDGDIQIVLNPAWVASSEASFVEINYSYLWDVLQKVYEIYGVRWTLEPVTGETRKYLIKFGYDAIEASHIFEYGYQGGLLKVERNVQSTDIKNIILGRGGNKNLPYLYFKDYDKYGTGTSEDTSSSSETETIGGVTASTISSLGKNQKTSVTVTYSGTFEVAEGKSGVLIAGIPEATGQYKRDATFFEILKYGKYKIYNDVEVVFISLGSPFIRVFNKKTGKEVSPIAIPSGEYYYTWENDVTNNYTDTIYNVKVSIQSLTLITGSGSVIGASVTGNRGFRPDPDAIPELKNIAFTELRSSEFREYVRGWKAAHYGGEVPAEPSETFIKGLTDEKFNPVEYVKDDDSILKYGEQWGALDNNEDIYPSIQGSGVEDIIAVDEQTNDVIDTDTIGTKTESIEAYKKYEEYVTNIYPSTTIDVGFEVVREFTVPDGKVGTLRGGATTISFEFENKKYKTKYLFTLDPSAMLAMDDYPEDGYENVDKVLSVFGNVWIRNISTNEVYEVDPIGFQLTPGNYELHIVVSAQRYMVPGTYTTLHHVLVECANFSLTTHYEEGYQWDSPYTFNVWVKNLWNTEKRTDETDKQYADRVWFPIIGQNDAEITFTSGLLAISSDYQFTIVRGGINYDTSKEYNGEQSHWRLTLKKSDAEFESTGLYIPNTRMNAKAGDKFFFSNVELPHQYVLWAEQRLHDYKVDNLYQVSMIKPKWLVSLDKVRCNNIESDDVVKLIDQIQVGSSLRIAHPFITDTPYDTLYVQSATYTYKEPSDKNPNIYPDVEIFLSDNIAPVTNPVSLMDSEINSLRQQISLSLSNIEQVVRAVGDRIYLRKDGITDVEAGYIRFKRGAHFEGQTDFKDDVIIGRDGYVGGLTGFGIRLGRDGVGEMDGLKLRRFLEVPELRYNRVDITLGNTWRAVCAGIIETVIPDTDDVGNQLDSGVIYLKLEDGEIGSVALDDICMGIFHNEIDKSINADTDTDDSKGNFTFAGFATVYFRITELLEDSRNSIFRYVLRAPDDTWEFKHHPQEGMTFTGYGNFTNKERQTSKYETRTYERYLKDVDNWTFSARNIAAQFGDLSNLGTVLGVDMSGYSIYLNNIYMTGRIQQLNSQGEEVPVITDRGVWSESEIYYKNDDVYHNNAKWRCLVDGTTSEPSKNSSAWLLLEEALKGDQGVPGLPGDPGLPGAPGAPGKDGSNYSPNLILGGNVKHAASTTYYYIWMYPLDGFKWHGGEEITVSACYSVGDDDDCIRMEIGENNPSFFFQPNEKNHEEIGVAHFTLPATPSRPEKVLAIAFPYIDGLFSTNTYVKWIVIQRGYTQGIDSWIPAASEMLAPTITETSVTYAKTTGTAQPADSAFTYTSINGVGVNLGDYLWTKTVVTYSDGNSTKSYSVGRVGADGADGVPGTPGVDGETPYTHWAYANSADGVTNFSTSYFDNALYMGICSDYNQADPTTPSSYTWARLKGEDGKDGADGKDGVNGCILRTSQWASGAEYHNDTDSTEPGVKYLDVVVINDGNGNQYRFQCVQTHTSDASNMPPTNLIGNAYWSPLSNMAPLYTPLLLADNAEINFANSTRILIKDEDGVVCAGLMADDTPFWLGADYENRNNAPFRINSKGQGVANDFTINGSYKGSIGYWMGADDDAVFLGDANGLGRKDNIVIPINSSTAPNLMAPNHFPWGSENIGRVIRLINYRWGTDYAQGRTIIRALTGYYFFENGMSYQRLVLSREMVELVGYGEPNTHTFYGWIVSRRIDLGTKNTYGSTQKILAGGTIMRDGANGLIVHNSWTYRMSNITTETWQIQEIGNDIKVFLPTDKTNSIDSAGGIGLTTNNAYVVTLQAMFTPPAPCKTFVALNTSTCALNAIVVEKTNDYFIYRPLRGNSVAAQHCVYFEIHSTADFNTPEVSNTASISNNSAPMAISTFNDTDIELESSPITYVIEHNEGIG